jgi:hypothetical protein
MEFSRTLALAFAYSALNSGNLNHDFNVDAEMCAARAASLIVGCCNSAATANSICRANRPPFSFMFKPR